MNEQFVSGAPRPAVTVVISTFNRAGIVGRAIRSVLAQTCQNWELIVVDDCSTDGTEQAVRSFSDARIGYIRHERNRRQAAARNTGIRSARGEYVAFLDDDDEWLPEKLEKELEVFRNSDPEVGLVYSGRMLVDGQGKVLTIRMPTKSGWVHEALLESDFIRSPSGAMLKKEVLDRVEGFDETFLNCEDYELWVRVTKVAKVACVPQCLFKQHWTSEWKTASLRNICAAREQILQKYRSEMTPRTLARQLSRIAPMLFNYEPRRARALAWEGLRIQPFQRALLGALAVSTLGTGCYRWVYRNMSKWRDRYYLGRARL